MIRVGDGLRLFVGSVLAFVTACAGAAAGSKPGSPPNALETTATARRSDRIGVADLRAFRGTTAADAVRELRPAFLQVHGQQAAPARAAVYVDGRYTGEPDVLALISVAEVSEIRYLGAMTAKNLFGSSCRCDGGVIFVRTRR